MINKIKKLNVEDKLELGTLIMTTVLWLIIIFALIFVPQNAETAKADTITPSNNLYIIDYMPINYAYYDLYNENNNFQFTDLDDVIVTPKTQDQAYISINGITITNTDTQYARQVKIAYLNISQFDTGTTTKYYNIAKYNITNKPIIWKTKPMTYENYTTEQIIQSESILISSGSGTINASGNYAHAMNISSGYDQYFPIMIVYNIDIPANTSLICYGINISKTNVGTPILTENVTSKWYNQGYTQGLIDGETPLDEVGENLIQENEYNSNTPWTMLQKVDDYSNTVFTPNSATDSLTVIGGTGWKIIDLLVEWQSDFEQKEIVTIALSGTALSNSAKFQVTKAYIQWYEENIGYFPSYNSVDDLIQNIEVNANGRAILSQNRNIEMELAPTLNNSYIRISLYIEENNTANYGELHIDYVKSEYGEKFTGFVPYNYSYYGYTDGYQNGYTAGEQDGYADGYEAGENDGYQDGFADGRLAGIDEEQLNQLNAQPNLLYNGQFTYSFTNQNSFYKTWTNQSDISSFVPYWNIQSIADNVTMAVSQNNAGNSALRITAGNSNDYNTRASIYTDFWQTGIDRNNAVDHIKMLENTKYNLSIWVEESRQDEYEYGNITVGLMFIKTYNSTNEADWTIKDYIIPPNTSLEKGGTNSSWWTLEKFIFTTPQNDNADWDLCRVIINFKNTVQIIVYDTKLEYGESYTGINVNKYAISKYGYSSAYNDGYTAGVVDGSDSDIVAQQVSEAYNNGYTNGYINGNAQGSENGYNNGYNVGRENGYQAGKADGYNAGLEESNAYSWSSLIGSVVNAPINMIFGTPTKNETTGVIERQNGLLTWELPLGDSTLHIKEFVMGILSILLVAVVIKLVMKFIA